MNDDYIQLIKSTVPVVELLAGLAEEAAELAQAALKLRRTFNTVNPTPEQEDEAYEHLIEEIADVKVYLSTLSINNILVKEIERQKKKRWADRIRRAIDERETGGKSGS